MGIEDHRIAWTRKRLWLTPFDIQGLVGNGTSGLVGGETAGVTTAEVNAAGMMTLIMIGGEILTGYFPCPIDLDPQYNVGFRICHTLNHVGTGNATTSWIMLQNAIAEGVLIVLPTAALDTPIPLLDAYTDDTGANVVDDFRLQWTDRGIRNTIGLTRSQIEKGAFITVNIEMNTNVNVTSQRFIGMEMDYSPIRTVGSGMHLSAPLQSDGKA